MPNTCSTCRNKQTFSCGCAPKCRQSLPYFPTQGGICPKWEERRPGT